MKKYTLLLITIFALITISFSQKAFIGTINYKLELDIEDIEDAQKALIPTEMSISTDGVRFRIDQISPIYTMSIVYDSKKNSGLFMSDVTVMGQKYSANLTKEDADMFISFLSSSLISPVEHAASNTTKKIKINYVEETKTIAGYKCQKAEGFDDETKTEFVVFATDALIFADDIKKHYIFVDEILKGIPLEIVETGEKGSQKIVVKEVIAKKPKSSIWYAGDDYEPMPEEQIKAMLNRGTAAEAE
jgi:GLPGLI family protein